VIVDGKSQPNQTTLTFWVSGGDVPPSRDVKQEVVQLIPDKQEYVGGDTAELLVQAPFYPAEGVVTWRRSGIVKAERVTLAGPTTTIKVPITDALVPNLFVQVDLVGAAPRTDDKGDVDPKLPKRPAYAVGSINLPVPPKQRTLKVDVAPAQAKVAPGESTRISLVVRDAFGKPVPNAETAVIVVDEAILALTDHSFVNPIDVFYEARGPGAQDHYSRAYVTLARPDASTLAQGQQMRARASATKNGVSRAESAMSADSMATGGAPAPAAPPPAPGAMPKPMEVLADADPNAARAIAIRSNFNPHVLAVGQDRRGGARHRRGQGAGQPDALPDRRDLGGGRQAVRQGRELAHRPLAADGPAQPAAVPQLR
jgi:hypothetical protein